MLASQVGRVSLLHSFAVLSFQCLIVSAPTVVERVYFCQLNIKDDMFCNIVTKNAFQFSLHRQFKIIFKPLRSLVLFIGLIYNAFTYSVCCN